MNVTDYISTHHEDILRKEVSAKELAFTIFAGQHLPSDAEEQVVKAFAAVTAKRLGYDKAKSITGRKPGRTEEATCKDRLHVRDDNTPTPDELKQEQ